LGSPEMMSAIAYFAGFVYILIHMKTILKAGIGLGTGTRF